MKTYSCEVGGKTLTFSTGKFALQTNASVTVQYGDTMVLATITKSDSTRPGVDYFPLMVDYEEKLYASGKIKGSRFIKREGRPSDEAVTNARMIDRSIRPLFDQRIKEDIQVVSTVLSQDDENDADVVAIIAASAAAALSDIPFNPVIAASRVGRINGEWVLNPSYEAREKSDLDLVVSSSEEKVLMLEGDAAEILEEDFIAAISFAKKHNKTVLKCIHDMVAEIGLEKFEVEVPELPENVKQEIIEFASPKLEEVLYLPGKQDRKKGLKNKIKELSEELKEKYISDDNEETAEWGGLIVDALYGTAENVIRTNIIESEKRIDDRKIDEVRTLTGEVSLIPRTHGSGFFTRGETHVLTIATLAGPGAEQIVDGMEEEFKKRYMHHYNFPPFSVGDVRPLRGPSRRDIGHGMLAERALQRQFPGKEEFPYTVRLVSEVLGSNGSSSMAATCGSSLALFDAGVPIKKHVAGVAMGIAQDFKGGYKVLTDLQDLEDSEGGMDFKLAGTRDGVCAVQLDVKSDGLTDDMVKDTVMQNKKARLELLDVMYNAIPEPRKELSPYAPRVISISIDPEKIRDVIGPGGKMINEIIEKTGVEIDIEDDGTVMITSVDGAAADKAIELIQNITKEAQVGEVYTGTVTRVMDFGAFVKIFGETEGLIHISKLAKGRVNKVTDVVNVGDTVEVKVIEIDDMKRINLMLISKK